MTRFFNTQPLLSLLLGASLCFLSTSLFATTLKVSGNLIVSGIDNQSVEHSFIGTKSVFELGQGTHVVVLRYKGVFEDLDFAEERVVESKEFVVKFTVTDEKLLNLATVNIKNLTRAYSFAKSPELTLENEHKEQLEIQLQKIDDYKLAKQVSIAVNTFASTQSVKKPKEFALAIPTVGDASATLDNKQQNNRILIQVNSLAMLKYWWQNASDEEKKHFKKYITLDN